MGADGGRRARATAWALAIWLAAAGAALAAADPVFAPGGPDAEALGAAQGYPSSGRARPARHQLVGQFTAFDRHYAHNTIARAPRPSVLRRADRELEVLYTYQQAARSIDGYLARHPATGLLIAKGDTILLERYQYGRTDKDRFLSQSMAKTLTALLVGFALQDGAIRSVDDLAEAYAPGLRGTVLGGTSIRHLLQMSSGVAYREVYDGNDDSAKLSRALFSPQGHGAEQALAQFDRREVPAGTRFHYVGAETETLGVAVARATGSTLAKLLETRVWQPMDAEADATWAVDSRGLETAYCCVSAVLRDWARVGLMLAHDGAWNGRQIVPRNWVIDMTSVAAPQFAPGAATRANGYGYQTWLLPGPGRQFALLGTLGQGVYIDPAAKLVMVHTAAREKPSGDPAIAELMALWRALPR